MYITQLYIQSSHHICYDEINNRPYIKDHFTFKAFFQLMNNKN